MKDASLISFVTWRRAVLGAGVGVVFGIVLTAFLLITGVLSVTPGTTHTRQVVVDALNRGTGQLLPWMLLWLIVIPALLRIRMAQPWLSLLGYAAFAVFFVPQLLTLPALSTTQLVAVFVFAIVTGLPVVRAADAWLAASFLVALNVVIVSVMGLPFGSTAGYGLFNARLSGDISVTGGRLGPVFGIFGILGMLWIGFAILQHQRVLFARVSPIWRSRRDAFRDFSIGVLIAGAGVSLMFAAMLLTAQARVVGFEPTIAAITLSVRKFLPYTVGTQLLFLYVSVALIMLVVRRGRYAVPLACAVVMAIHLSSPGATIYTAAGVGAVGLATGSAFIKTGRLWMPIGIAVGWMFFEGPIFGFASGGFPVAQPWFRQEMLQDSIWSGGVHGPDASLFGTIAKLAMAAAVVYITLGTDYGSTLKNDRSAQ